MKNWANSNYKRQILTILLVSVLCAGMAAGCTRGNNGEEDVVEKVSEEDSQKEQELKEPKKEQIKFSSEDLKGIVTGLDEEAYVLTGSSLDLLSLLTYDTSIVTKVTVEKLDLSTVADLKATYTFTVDAKALCKALGRDFHKSDVKESRIVASKKIKVVDQAAAQKLADAGKAVYNDTGTTLAKSDTSAGSVKDTSSESASVFDKNKDHSGNSESTGNTENHTDENAGNSANSGVSPDGGSSGNAGNKGNSPGNETSESDTPSSGEPAGDIGSGESGGSTADTHTHNWVDMGPMYLDWSGTNQEDTGYTSSSEIATWIQEYRYCGFLYENTGNSFMDDFWTHSEEPGQHGAYTSQPLWAVYHCLECSECGIYKRGALAYYEYPAFKDGIMDTEHTYYIQLTAEQVAALGLPAV